MLPIKCRLFDDACVVHQTKVVVRCLLSRQDLPNGPFDSIGDILVSSLSPHPQRCTGKNLESEDAHEPAGLGAP